MLSVPSFLDPSTRIRHTNVFATIGQFTGNQFSTQFQVLFYTSNPTINTSLQPFFIKEYVIRTTIINGLSIVYQYLQLLPDFRGSTII